MAPFALRVPWASSCYLVIGKASARRPVVQAFREWLLGTVGTVGGEESGLA